MDKIIMISEESYIFIRKTLRQCEDWLRNDAKYSHSQSNIRAVHSNVAHSIGMLYGDIEKYKDNIKIINKLNEGENV